MATKDAICLGVVTEIGRTDLLIDAATWFDDIYALVNSYGDWQYLEVLATRATVANTYKYALPADFRNARLIYCDTGDSNSRKLVKRGIHDFVRRHPRIDSEGGSTPEEYATYGGNLLLAPKPSAVYTLRLIYIYNPPALSGSSTPITPEKWLGVLRMGIRGHAYARIREFEKSASTFKEFFENLKVMLKEEENDGTDDMRLKRFGESGTLQGEYWKMPEVRYVG